MSAWARGVRGRHWTHCDERKGEKHRRPFQNFNAQGESELLVVDAARREIILETELPRQEESKGHTMIRARQDEEWIELRKFFFKKI